MPSLLFFFFIPKKISDNCDAKTHQVPNEKNSILFFVIVSWKLVKIPVINTNFLDSNVFSYADIFCD